MTLLLPFYGQGVGLTLSGALGPPQGFVQNSERQVELSFA